MGVLSNNYAQIIPGAMISASYVSDIYEVLMGSEPEALKVTGSLTVTGSIISTAGVTASLQGTASYSVTASRAVSALTASYAVSASYLNYINTSSQSDTAITASYALTASYVVNSVSSSYSDISLSSSFASNSVSSSYSLTSSYSPTYINTASIAGSTISFTKGDSTTFDISIPASEIYFTNSFYVDPSYGNNITAQPGNLTKPYATYASALTAASASYALMVSSAFATYSDTSASYAAGTVSLATFTAVSSSYLFTTQQRRLIVLKPGQYTETCYVNSEAEVHCSPGVIFTAGGFYSNKSNVTTRVTGFARFISSSLSLGIVHQNNNITFECDEVNNTNGEGVFFIGSGGNGSSVVFNANELYGDNVNGQTVNLRWANGVNVIMNIKRRIRGPYRVLHINRQFGGQLIVNCPELVLTDSGSLGRLNEFKQVIHMQDWTFQSNRIIINGNLYSEVDSPMNTTTDAIISTWGNAGGIVHINGNIYANRQRAILLYGYTKLTHRGNIICYEGKVAGVYNTTQLNLVGSNVWYFNSASVPMDCSNSGQIHMNSTTLYSENPDQNMLYIGSTSARVYANNVLSQGSGSSGYFVHVPAAGYYAGLINVTANQQLNPNLSSSYSSTGFTYEPNVTVPKYMF